jgi:hypothetical protein
MELPQRRPMSPHAETREVGSPRAESTGRVSKNGVTLFLFHPRFRMLKTIEIIWPLLNVLTIDRFTKTGSGQTYIGKALIKNPFIVAGHQREGGLLALALRARTLR